MQLGVVLVIDFSSFRNEFRIIVLFYSILFQLSELAVASPLLHHSLRALSQWHAVTQLQLDMFSGPPDSYIPSLSLAVTGQPRSKLQAIMMPENSPFV